MAYHTFHENHKLRQIVALATQGSVTTAWFEPFATSGINGDATKAVFLVNVGTIGSGVTLTAKLQQSKTDGTGTKDVPGSTIPTFTETEDERIRSVEIDHGALDNKNGYTRVRLVVTAAGGTAIWGAWLLTHNLRYPGYGEQHSTYDVYISLPYDNTL